jgi:hypothetical protein
MEGMQKRRCWEVKMCCWDFLRFTKKLDKKEEEDLPWYGSKRYRIVDKVE